MNRPRSRRLWTLAGLLTVTLTLPAAAQVGDHREVLDPNLATIAELQALGLEAGTVTDLVAARPFLDMVSFDDFLAKALDEEARRGLYPRLFLPINLNHATKAEIGLVPGMGPRMTHEFEEYRPYRGLAEFHREIGKYVDDEELARLAQFVFVPMDPNTVTRDHFLTIPGVDEGDWESLQSGRPFDSLETLEATLAGHDDAGAARIKRYFEMNGG